MNALGWITKPTRDVPADPAPETIAAAPASPAPAPSPPPATSQPRAHTWRDFAHRYAEGERYRGAFPDVIAFTATHGAADGDTDLDGYGEIAAYLGLPEDFVAKQAENMRLPHLVIEDRPEFGARRYTRRWMSASQAQMKRAPVKSSTLGLTLWMLLNDPLRDIPRCIPGRV